MKIKQQYLSSASAFFLTSADRRTGVACLGSESWCCFFSLNQASASTHSFNTYHISIKIAPLVDTFTTKNNHVQRSNELSPQKTTMYKDLMSLYLLLFCHVNVIEFKITRHCCLSVTINTINKLINHRSPICVLLVPLFNRITLLQPLTSLNMHMSKNQTPPFSQGKENMSTNTL